MLASDGDTGKTTTAAALLRSSIKGRIWRIWKSGPAGWIRTFRRPGPRLNSTSAQLELAKWLTREAGEDKSDLVIAFTETCAVADLDTATAVSATELCARHRLATADAIVYATTLYHPGFPSAE